MIFEVHFAYRQKKQTMFEAGGTAQAKVQTFFSPLQPHIDLAIPGSVRHYDDLKGE